MHKKEKKKKRNPSYRNGLIVQATVSFPELPGTTHFKGITT